MLTERSWEHILDFLFLPALGHWGNKSRLIPILALPYQRWPEKRQLLTSKDWETEVLFELLLVEASASSNVCRMESIFVYTGNMLLLHISSPTVLPILCRLLLFD